MQPKLVVKDYNRLLLFLAAAQKQVLPRGLRFATSTLTGPALHSVEPQEVGPKSPLESSPKLEHAAVGPRKEPITQQKRRITAPPLDDVSCAGMDGSPWPAEDRKDDDDDREYFKHHKASPLSEIEFADTRKSIASGTQNINSFSIGYERDQVLLWRPEQLDSAEDSLYRAAQIFRQRAAEGDPDSPHARVLRALLGHDHAYVD